MFDFTLYTERIFGYNVFIEQTFGKGGCIMTSITPDISYDKKYYKTRRKKKRLIIVNRARFITVSLITLILFSIIIGYFTGMMTSEAATSMNTIEYSVKTGDTLWSIASDYNYYDTDIREVIYHIKKENHMHNAVIHPGDRLLIPVTY